MHAIEQPGDHAGVQIAIDQQDLLGGKVALRRVRQISGRVQRDRRATASGLGGKEGEKIVLDDPSALVNRAVDRIQELFHSDRRYQELSDPGFRALSLMPVAPARPESDDGGFRSMLMNFGGGRQRV